MLQRFLSLAIVASHLLRLSLTDTLLKRSMSIPYILNIKLTGSSIPEMAIWLHLGFGLDISRVCRS